MDIDRIEVVDDAIAEILRRKSPAERLGLAFDCNRTMRLRIEGRLRSIHPDWSDTQIAVAVAHRISHGTK